MSSLVLDLQRAALDSKTSVADLLRIALVVARKLKIVEFEKWIKLEQGGYTPESDIPAYRKLAGRSVVFNPVRGWQPLLLNRLKPEVADRIRTFHIIIPVGEIESYLRDKDTLAFHLTFRPREERMLMQAIHAPLQPANEYQRAQFEGLLEAVRAIVLNWSLKLEEDGILGEGMTFSPEEKSAAGSTIYNIKNYIGEVSHSQVQQDTWQSTQTANVNSLDPREVGKLLSSLKTGMDQLNLDSEQQAELAADISTIEAQIKSPKPKETMIREVLGSVRSILEGAVGSALAAGALSQIAKLLGS
jgi:hypothetical protein